MRRIVFCFDGSWNKLSADKEPTNVVLLSESVLPVTSKGVNQIVYYDEGVGTSSDDTLRGGAFGKGLVENIREAYRFLIFNYKPGDEIFIFGFSRGGFTALSFCGFLRCVGIISVNDARQIDKAWGFYKTYAHRDGDDPDDLKRFRALYCRNVCVDHDEMNWRISNLADFNVDEAHVLRIKYVGVWDVVGSIGFDVVKSTFWRSNVKKYKHHDTRLSNIVEKGRHAVSIDERRVHFVPTLWGNVKELNELKGVDHKSEAAPYQQKWFPGDHGSIGGGGPERGLSNAALHWIVKGATESGLEINLGGRSQLKTIRYNQRAPLRNSPASRGFGALFGRVKAFFLSKDRVGPQDVFEISNAALRRWFTRGSELPEGVAYRPKPLLKLEYEISSLSVQFMAVADQNLELKGSEYVDYIVQQDDTLSKIARDRLGNIKRYQEIFELNRDRIDHVDDVFPGDVIRLPAK